MVLKGLVSVSISLNVFVMYTWTTVGYLPNQGLKGLVYLFEIYTQNIIILFFSYDVLWNLCHYAISVYMLCRTKWN